MTDQNGNSMVMPVTPFYGNGGNGDGMWNGMGGLWGLIILLAVLGYGNGNGGLFGGGGGNQGAAVQRGFDQNSVMNGIGNIQNGMTAGFGNVQNALCNGFAGVNGAISNGFAQAEISANARQMADMNQNFAMQSAFQNCCCENRQATADLKYTMATEAAATRANCDGNNQKILDKLCQMELDGIKQNYENRIAGISQNYEGQLRAMQNQLNAATAENQSLRFAASQGAQTAQILANNEAQTSALEQYLAPIPRPAYVVQNPNCCTGQFGYGGCGGYAA